MSPEQHPPNHAGDDAGAAHVPGAGHDRDAVVPARPDADRQKSSGGPERREVTMRRAPRFAPFMALGALLGFIAALFVAYAGPGDETLTRESILGFFTMVLAIPGLLLGALLVLVLDRVSVRRSRRLTAERTYDDDEHAD